MIDRDLKRVTSTEHIYKLLQKDIVNGVYKEKQRLREIELSEIYKTSTTPIREAMNRLVCEGYLESVPYKGVYIKAYSTEDVYEAYWVFNKIQIQYFERAFRMLNEKELLALECLLEETIEGDKNIHIYQRVQVFFQALKKLAKSSILESCIKSILAVINLETGIRDSRYIDQSIIYDIYQGILRGFVKRDLTVIEFYFCKLTELTSANLQFSRRYNIKQ